MKLEYFGVHGRALGIRMMFNHTGTDFEDYKMDFATFGANKAAGKYKFGQVPMLVLDDGTELYQTASIMRYLGKTLGNGAMYPGNKDPMNSYQQECIMAENDKLLMTFVDFLVPIRPGYKDKDTHFLNFITEHFPKFLAYFEG